MTGPGQRMRQGDREPGLADAALAGGDGKDVALAQGGAGRRVGRGSSLHGGGHHRARSGVGCTPACDASRSEEHTSELQSHLNLVCRLLLEKKKRTKG